MHVVVPSSASNAETRVAIVPETVAKLVKAGIDVTVETGAGTRAALPDALFEAAGARVSSEVPLAAADAVFSVGRPSEATLRALRPGAVVVGLLSPFDDREYRSKLASAGVTAIAMELLPRITRAQTMDVLSSQSNIAGYKAVLVAAATLPKFFPMLMTAAGTIAPAKVLVLGAGVAGLQAIATARRLGAVVSAYDVRAVVKEQVMSLGATFLEMDLGDAEGSGGYAKELGADQIDRQRQFMVEHIGNADVVITTALIPGKPAPVLVTQDAVAAMRAGSVIVDLAAEAGGNCAVTRPGETIVTPGGVTIVGETNLARTMANHASQLYSRNLYALFTHLLKDGSLTFDFDDEITNAATIAHGGSVRNAGST